MAENRTLVRSPPRHYHPIELLLDRQIHHAGIIAGVIGTVWLLVAASSGGIAVLLSCLAYVLGLLAMLVCSTLYNRQRTTSWSRILRRLDHAAIFVLIAGTYTPFTVNRLPIAWSIAMTTTIWALALTGAAIKLFCPGRLERGSTLLYLALGWIGILAFRPLVAVLDQETLILLGSGAILYTVGTLFHTWQRLPFQNAVWHGFVMTASVCHYLAVFHGVVASAA
jgi:hemolysin III